MIDLSVNLMLILTLCWKDVIVYKKYSSDLSKSAEDTYYLEIVVVASVFLWLKLIGYFKGLNLEFATFILMIQRILFDIKEVP